MRATARLALIAVAAAGCGPREVGGPAPVFRGHQDVLVGATGALPWVLGRSGRVGVCLDVPPDTDTSRWEARLFGDGFAPPAARLDTVVCFDAPLPADLRNGTSELCAEVRDGFDGSSRTLPCVPFRFDADDTGLRALEKRIPEALRGPIDGLDALSAEAAAQGFPGFALRARLIAAYTLRRGGNEWSRVAAARRLEDAPSWVELPVGARWAGQLAYEGATLALDADADLATCWRLLRSAEARFRSCADRKWIAVVGKQAEVLSRAGALEEGKGRLRAALAACAAAPCDPGLVRANENTLAWLVASDPDAGDDELASADELLRRLSGGDEAPRDPFEHANLLLNLAFVEVARGLDPEPTLARARELIGPGPTFRARELSGWADLVEARRALSLGRPERAAAICGRLDDPGTGDRLRAHALGCGAVAERLRGDRAKAADELARALALHDQTSARRLKQDLPLGPGRRAEDAYAAARLEVERDRPGAAWSILRALDAGGSSSARKPPPWLAGLPDLDRPASGARREQRQAIRWGALDRLQELLRGDVTSPSPAPPEDGAVDFRAFPADDEIVVLRRTASGTIETYRRTAMPRHERNRLVRVAREAIDRGERDDARWAELVRPLAVALAPLPEDLGPVTTIAVHGVLQEVPLAALPVRSGGSTRWLGEVTTVASHAAGGRRGTARGTRAHGAVVVSDPRLDLGAPEPAAAGDRRLLRGGGATREALRLALDGARRLHVDAHARYEPAFPELSTILLSDGPVTGYELAAWGSDLELANLSGCQTGRSPVSADSGRFGIAGLLARSGVTWVVGTRAPLDNELAQRFNRAFDAGLADGRAVPEAYRLALDDVRGRYPASLWGVLLLLHGTDGEKGGQSVAQGTPSESGGVR